MWILILERVVYFQLVHPLRLKKTVRHWESRSEKSSWYAKKIRELEVSQISHKLNHSLPMIKTLVMLCPLLGLLGTVTGMIEVFDIMAIVGSGNARAMASGVSKATIPTMAGMVAALSGIYFSARLDRTAKKKIAHVEDCLTQE
ncbi:MAG: MotA/TolQ/ExbB proton channel family protein [Proteobacteria bacterium]|nr:MotA/TolQ/ExbB proton channel family protein [Pseudomonadota bacterium]